MNPPQGGTAPPDDPLAQTVLRTLLYLRHGEIAVFALAQSITELITTYREDRMTAEQTLDQAINDLKAAAAEERQAAVAAFARVSAVILEIAGILPGPQFQVIIA